MADRLDLAVFSPPPSSTYDWLRLVNETEDDPSLVLQNLLSQTHHDGLTPCNPSKMKILETALLRVLKDHPLLEVVERAHVPWPFKLQLLRRLKQEGSPMLYCRCVLRTLSRDLQYAQETLHLDRDEELEAIHHLSKIRAVDPQVAYELGLWAALQENFAEAAFHFGNLFKSLPPDYRPTLDEDDLTTLTLAKLKGYLGIYAQPDETEVDESHARELFHFCLEVDNVKRIHRESLPTEANEEQSQINLTIFRDLVFQSRAVERGRKLLALAAKQQASFNVEARTAWEELFKSASDEGPELWKECLWSCAIITAVEEMPSEDFFDLLVDLLEKTGSPDIHLWALFLGVTIHCPHQKRFLTKTKQTQLEDEPIKWVKMCETLRVLLEQPEPYDSDFLEQFLVSFLEQVEQLKQPLLKEFLRGMQSATLTQRLSRWFLTALRVLKFTNRKREDEADQLFMFSQLINFEDTYMIDIPTDVDYKIKTRVHDFALLCQCSLAVLHRANVLSPTPLRQSFLGNFYLLKEKFHLACQHLLRAARLMPGPRLFTRLVYCLLKVNASWEAVVLAQLTDTDFKVDKFSRIVVGEAGLKSEPAPQLRPFILSVELLELLIQFTPSQAVYVRSI
mmetsp:Transcript_18494/g.33350  ORF Transcript_18494/g.33350 Transcript_18494/m.33350 type:complete len:621 (-) Transcript_18494:2496-4358(-)